jgi:hypothetical protein
MCVGIEYFVDGALVSAFFDSDRPEMPLRLRGGRIAFYTWGARGGIYAEDNTPGWLQKFPEGGHASLEDIRADKWTKFDPKPARIVAASFIQVDSFQVPPLLPPASRGVHPGVNRNDRSAPARLRHHSAAAAEHAAVAGAAEDRQLPRFVALAFCATPVRRVFGHHPCGSAIETLRPDSFSGGISSSQYSRARRIEPFSLSVGILVPRIQIGGSIRGFLRFFAIVAVGVVLYCGTLVLGLTWLALGILY